MMGITNGCLAASARRSEGERGPASLLRKAVVASLLLAAVPAAAYGQSVERGEAILEENCARCHAIGKTGESPFNPAPPFRTLHENYPVEFLEEALAEGIISGHPAMPALAFAPEQIGDIIAYLKSLDP